MRFQSLHYPERFRPVEQLCPRTGRLHVATPYTLLLDADIELARGVITALREKMHRQGVPFISLMAAPSMSGSWEKLLMPAFVHFFKVLYPFGRVNSNRTRVAARGDDPVRAD
jgi:hypothetical protein